MPSIFKKIFRRSKSKKSRKKKPRPSSDDPHFPTDPTNITGPLNNSILQQTNAPHDEVIRKPSFNTSTSGDISKSFSGSSSSSKGSGKYGGLNQNNNHGTSRKNSKSGDSSYGHGNDSDSPTHSIGPENDENAFVDNNGNAFVENNENAFVADFSEFNNKKPQDTNRLDYDSVQKIPMKPLYTQSTQSNKHQLTRLPNGQLQLTSLPGDVPSPMSAESEFDLSTDAEDNAYNELRRSANNNMTPMLEPSAVSSSDEDVSLNTIRKNDPIVRKNISYLSNSESDTEGPMETGNENENGAYFSDTDLEPEGRKPVSPQKEGDDVPFKYSHSGSTEGSGLNEVDPNEVEKSFEFEHKFDETLAASQSKAQNFRTIIQSPSSGGASSSTGSTERSLNTNLSPRTVAIQQAQNMKKQGKLPTELYPDSTDSELDNTNPQYQQKDLLPPRSKSTDESNSIEDDKNPKPRNNEVVIENFADFGQNNFSNSYELGSRSVDPTSPVSELLRQAKDRRNRRKESSSVNSAPITNVGYIQQQNTKRNKPRTSKTAASSARARSDDASASASSAAKEKLRRRRYEKEAYLKSLNNDSDEGSEKGGDGNESWLIDEVTGALGPRGIAADLESLGERSGISKASHRSNGKVRRKRRTKRSDESVGSRHSRQSRSSRYSVKSSKSQASVVSEQSRSVANDLMRLEMQLARVGSKKHDGEAKEEAVAIGNDINLGSRTQSSSSRITSSRSRNSVTRRVKLTVVAPAGKLGIILANKTDTRGTVVSGVRTHSPLADRISPGDRIIEIDAEDVSRMSVSEITAIMTRKNDYERVLTMLTTARDSEMNFAPHTMPSHGSETGNDSPFGNIGAIPSDVVA